MIRIFGIGCDTGKKKRNFWLDRTARLTMGMTVFATAGIQSAEVRSQDYAVPQFETIEPGLRDELNAVLAKLGVEQFEVLAVADPGGSQKLRIFTAESPTLNNYKVTVDRLLLPTGFDAKDQIPIIGTGYGQAIIMIYSNPVVVTGCGKQGGSQNCTSG